MGKKLLTSKTVWFALFLFVGSVLKVGGIADIPVGENEAWMGMAIGFIQMILRLVTKEPIVIK